MQEVIDTVNDLLDHGQADEVVGLFILSIAIVWFLYIFFVAFVRTMFDDGP